MLCNVCNTNLEPGATQCSNCGALVSNDANNLGQTTSTGYVPNNQTVYNQQNAINHNTSSVELPMNWFKFLIYCSLFLGALVNLWNAYQLLSGSIYKVDGFDGADFVYSVYPGLKAIDILYGILILAMAALCILTRQKLSAFSKQGPKLLMVLYTANVLIVLLYLVLVKVATDLSVSDLLSGSTRISLIIAVVMIVVNKTYFEKRAHLFVN